MYQNVILMNFSYINRYKQNHYSPAVWYVQQFDPEIPLSSIADVWPPSVNLLKFMYILKNGNNRLFFLYFSEGLVGWNFGAFVRTSISNIAIWFLLNRYFESILDILELIACLTLDIKFHDHALALPLLWPEAFRAMVVARSML